MTRQERERKCTSRAKRVLHRSHNHSKVSAVSERANSLMPLPSQRLQLMLSSVNPSSFAVASTDPNRNNQLPRSQIRICLTEKCFCMWLQLLATSRHKQGCSRSLLTRGHLGHFSQKIAARALPVTSTILTGLLGALLCTRPQDRALGGSQ